MSEASTTQTPALVVGDSLGTHFNPNATLFERLSAASASAKGGVVFVKPDGEVLRRSYGALREEALRIGAGLRAAGVRAGELVLLQLEGSEDYVPGLWGCIAVGAVPVPVAVAPLFSKQNSGLQKLLNAGKSLGASWVLAAGHAVEGLRTLPPELGTVPGGVLDMAVLRAMAPLDLEAVHRAAATDVAVMLLTSGSTGMPKGVPLTHRNLLAMAAGTIQANRFTSAEVALNWMALDHAGAVSFLGTMTVDLGCTQIHVPTNYILQQPLRWLDLIHRFRATISWAPNFAFTLMLDREAEIRAGTWDLGCMRFLVNAGESVVAKTARRFIALLQHHGLPKDALRPAFGMSETCSGITWSHGFTLENSSDDLAFVDLGPCIPGASMRIVDEAGKLLMEGETGLLQMRGLSVFAGYMNNEKENAQVFRDGWFTTGDQAFFRNSGLHITGRQKDIIIVNGANFHCHEIESVAEAVEGVMKTYTAACAVRDASAETDQLALFFCPTVESPETVEKIARSIRAKVIQEAGVPVAHLIALRPADIPKTEIGKIQRARLKKAFEEGDYRDRIVAAARSKARAAAREGRSRKELAPAIAEIWQDVLNVDTVGYDDTFFELGGHSMLVLQVQARLQALIGRPIPVVELFNFPTVRALAAHFAKEYSGGDGVLAGVADLPGSASAGGAQGSRDIAIIGIGLRFPGASGPEEFWRVLAEGRETIRTFTEEDALAAGIDPELVRHPGYVKAAPMLDAPESFDAEFFHYTAREARMIDPQQRVFLEVCWEAFEDAGYDPTSHAGRIGLFAAAGMNTYLANNLLANGEYLKNENGGRLLTVDSMGGFNLMITNDKDYLPTRVGYKLNLRGPCVNVQSACSSTLLTLHEACNSLLLGDCDMALAGGVSIKVPQFAGHVYTAGMLNSPDGHCRAYDEKAEGTIFGNGAGVVLLKPLVAAVRDGDRVYAVVKATASNNDGSGKVGFTAPSAAGEEDVCAQAMARAQVSADSITFMEGHGTGTPLGDPIEVSALTSAFRRHTGRSSYCALGSVKTNVGHLQIASGIAGLIKAALALHRKVIPGTLHFEKPNPRIDFANTPFFVNREAMPWSAQGGPRRAGVNSLGIGGTNVHVILEEAPAGVAEAPAANGVPVLLPLSARHGKALRELADRHAMALMAGDGGGAASLADIAYTAQVGRTPMPVRAAFVGRTREELAGRLRAFVATEQHSAAPIDFERKGVGFVFSGGCDAWVSVVERLASSDPVFREAWMRLAALADEELGDGLLRLPLDASRNYSGLRTVARFALETALAESLATYGIQPAMVAGCGTGEVAAACAAGLCAPEQGLRLLVALDRFQVAGASAAAAGKFRALVKSIEWRGSPKAYYWSGSGEKVDGACFADPDYWIGRLDRLGSLQDCAATLVKNGVGAVLSLSGQPEIAEDNSERQKSAPILGVLSSGDSDDCSAALLDCVGRLFVLGHAIDWRGGGRTQGRRRVALPTYPWQHRPFWIEGTDIKKAFRSDSLSGVASAAPGNPLVGKRWQSPKLKETIYETQWDSATLPYAADHRIRGQIVIPGAQYLTMLSRQASDLLRHPNEAAAPVAVLDVVFVQLMVLEEEGARTVQTIFTPDANGAYRFEVMSWPGEAVSEAILHVSGRVARTQPLVEKIDVRELGTTIKTPWTERQHYELMEEIGIGLGESFRWIRDGVAVSERSLIRLESPEAVVGDLGWHPGLVDSCLQALAAVVDFSERPLLIPFRVGQTEFLGNPGRGPLHAYAEKTAGAQGGNSTVRGVVSVYDSTGTLIARMRDFELRVLERVEMRATGVEPEYVTLGWKTLALDGKAASSASTGRWLVLSDGGACAERFSRALEACNQIVTVVGRGDVGAAKRHLREGGWNGVLHAWDAQVENASQIGWSDLLACVRAAADNAAEEPPKWVFLANGEGKAPAAAPLAGFALGLGQEFPAWRPLHIELGSASDADACVPLLLDRQTVEVRLRVRAGVAEAARLEELRLPAADAAHVRRDASYLVTGGSGGLGQAITAWLVEKGAGNIVLCGSREAGAELLAKIESWNKRGTSVDYRRVDMADAESVRRLVEHASANRPLRGVFHAAGRLHDGVLRQIQPEEFEAAFDAKIDGAWQLHLATASLALDWFVLFSSVAALLGSAGQANYAAGNAFMDALAAYRRREGLPGLSIQWGPWEKVGMSARLGERERRRLSDRGLRFMTPERALHAMERLLVSQESCVAVLAWDRVRYRSTLPEPLPGYYRTLFAGSTNDGETVATAAANNGSGKAISEMERFAAMDQVERCEALERMIRETVAGILGLSSYLEVDRSTGLFDLGVDSLTAVDLKNRLEKAVGRTLRTTIAFDYPTAAEMAAYLAQTLHPAPVQSAAPAKAVAAVPANAGTKPSAKEAASLDLAGVGEADLKAMLEKELGS